MITESLASGVLEIIKDISNHIVTDEIQLHLIYSRRVETPHLSKLEYLFNEKIKLIEVNGTRDVNAKKDLTTLLQYIKLMREIRPDVIHLHSTKAGVLGRIANLFYRANNIFYSPHGFSFLRKDISKWKSSIYRLIEGTLSIIPGKIVAVSESEYNVARRVSLVREVILINNGLNTDEVSHLSAKKANRLVDELPFLTSEKKVIATVGRLSHQKNPFFVAEFMKELNKRIPNEFLFVWVGGGELENQLVEILKKDNLDDCFHITGWLEKEEVICLLKHNTDYYVQFSLWEGLPISLLEAMYLEKAPIVSNVIGNKDVIVNDKCGRVVENVEEAVNALIEYRNNSTDYKLQSQNAKDRVQRDFSLSKMITNYKKLYKIE